MKLSDCDQPADENIRSDVIASLRWEGFDVVTAGEAGLAGASDTDVLQHAFQDDRVVVTHDSDFGTLAILGGEPVFGIIFLRPGHIDPHFTIETFNAMRQEDLDLTPPFILVAHRRDSHVKIRLRDLS